MQPFPEPQSQRVDRPEIGAVVERSDGGDELSHLVDGEHVGECLVPADVEALESGPVTRRGVGIEEPDAAASDDQRGRGELAVVLEVQQIVAGLLLGEPVRWGVEVVGQLPDGAEIGLLGALAQTGELEVLEHPLMESLVMSWSLGKGEETASARNLGARPGMLPGRRESAGIPVTTDKGQATLSEGDSSCRASGLLEQYIKEDPAASFYYSSRPALEDILRQERGER